MLRPYTDNIVVNTVSFFVGTEIENTPFKGQRTLFVANPIKDNQDLFYTQKQIKELTALHHCEHIYLGANKWIKTKIDLTWTVLLLKDIECNVTLDLPYQLYIESHEFLNRKLATIPNLHYNISVEIPNCAVGQITVKVDDIGFNATNPGVWCYTPTHNAPEFTGWEDYSKDQPI
jgi:hypothetical protein